MLIIEFELMRVITAPVEGVFDRIADIDGYGEWMPTRGSLLRKTQQTSAGPVGLGTTLLRRDVGGRHPGRHRRIRAAHDDRLPLVGCRVERKAAGIHRPAHGGRLGFGPSAQCLYRRWVWSAAPDR